MSNFFPCEPDLIDFTNHKFQNMACIAVSERLFNKIKYGTDMNSVLIEPGLFVLGATSMAFVNSIWVPPKYRQFAPTLSTISIELLNRSPYLKFSQGVNVTGLLTVRYFHSFRLRLLRWSDFYYQPDTCVDLVFLLQGTDITVRKPHPVSGNTCTWQGMLDKPALFAVDK